MTANVSETFAQCREIMEGDRPHRVWSLIVTVFGDLAQPEGSRISGAVLGQIMDLVGIRPEAMRVALHRLRKDGWIESRRAGRVSSYELTEFGRRQSAEASPLIYGPGPAPDAPLHVVVADDSSAAGRKLVADLAQGQSHELVGSTVAIGLGAAPRDMPECLILNCRDAQVPAWLKSRICPPEINREYTRLHQALRTVDQTIGQKPALAPLERAALRTLIVHSWRRVVLRHANLPPQFFPKGCRVNDCRSLTHAILARLPVDRGSVLDTTPAATPT